MNERRRRQRLPWIQIAARIRIKKSLLSSEWLDAQVLDYSALGMAIITTAEIKESDRILVSLRLSTEVGDITLDKVQAEVRNKRDEEGKIVFGVEFSEDKAAIKDTLARIENLLNRHAEVSQRLR